MIRSSPSLKVGMFVVSVAIHGGFAYAFFSEPEIEIAGGSTAIVEARLGNSFADLAHGADVPDVMKTLVQDPVETTTHKLPQEATARSRPLETITSKSAVALETLETVPAENTASAVTLQKQGPKNPPTEYAMTASTNLLVEEPAPETQSAQEENAVKESPRPIKRPERPTRKAQRHEAQPKAQGNSNRNAVAGSADGNATAKATQRSTNSGRSSANGNAAASNYPGQVMQAIQRVRKPRVGSRGLALVGFAIGGNGGLQSVGISRSSGSARLDREALKIVEKASPFPAPPAGAQRRYRIEIEFRR